MIRNVITETRCCPTCRRDGWVQRKHFSLKTEEEAAMIFKDMELPVERVPGYGDSYEHCWAGGGATIHEACREGVEIAKLMAKPVVFKFNDRIVECQEDSDPSVLVDKWWRSCYGESERESFLKR